MTRWLVNTLPTWALGLLIVGGFVALGTAAHRIASKRFPQIHDESNFLLARPVFTPVMGLFGVLLAFTIFGLSNDRREVQRNVEHEAAELAEIYQDSRLFPEHVRLKIDAAIIEYVAIVARDEWPAMAEGDAHPEAFERVESLYAAFQGHTPKPGPESVFYDEAVGDLDEWLEARRIRIDDAEHGLPAQHLLLLVGGALLLTLFLVMASSTDSWVQTIQIGIVVTLVGFNLLLVLLLNHPFSGDLAVGPEPFREGVLGELLSGAAPN